MPWVAAAPAVIGAVGAIGGGLAGAGAQRAASEEARAAYERSIHDLEQIGIPTVEAQQIVMEQYKSEGQWTPELEESVSLGNSAMEGVSTDPQYRAAQLKALGNLQEIGDSGGMTLSDKANLERVEGGIAAKQRGSREAILQDAQQRGGGVGNGGALAAQLMAQQGGAQEAHMAGLETAANAQQRALQAIQGAGNLGTSLRGQEFGEKEKIAAARDAINKWNAANRQDVVQRNAASRNSAQQYNLNNAQNLSNSNVDARNKEQLYNKGLLQQQYQNQMQVATAKANARAGQATQAVNAGNQQAQMWGNVGGAIAQGATAYGQMSNENSNRAADRTMYEEMAKKYGSAPSAAVMP